MPLKCFGACVAVFICIAVSRPGAAQQEFARPPDETAFELSISQEFDEASKPLIVVSTSIPYRRLVFFMRGSAYEARYRVYLELTSEHGKLARGEVWEESVPTANAKETTSAAMMASSRKTFPVAPGEYRATVTIEVIDTSRRFSREETVRVVGEGMGRLDVSKLVFYTQAEDSLSSKPRDGEIAVSPCHATGGGRSRINSGAVYGDFNAWVRAAFNLVTPSPKVQTPFTLSARVRDTRGVIVLYTRRLLEGIDGAHAAFCLDINIDHLVVGEYEIGIVAETRDGTAKSESQGRFTVLFNRGLLSERIADLVEILSVIATKKDVDEIATAPPEQRMTAWANFWRKRDPTPSIESNEAFEEFLQRFQEVLKSFSRVQPGWRTDMGKTYLANGRPDKVENRQDSRLGGNYQLWYYYTKGIAYIFEDTMGTGEYHLLSTEMI